MAGIYLIAVMKMNKMVLLLIMPILGRESIRKKEHQHISDHTEM